MEVLLGMVLGAVLVRAVAIARGLIEERQRAENEKLRDLWAAIRQERMDRWTRTAALHDRIDKLERDMAGE